MPRLNPYLNFPGTCEAAFNFYKGVFGGDFGYVGKFKDMPPQEGVTMSEDELNNIMHISLPVGDAMLMGSDTGGEWAPDFKVGNNVQLSVNVDSRAEADRVFNALSNGGNVSMPMADMFWGDYYGMCTDQFGVNWMVSYNAQQAG